MSLRRGSQPIEVAARVVICADGLLRSSLRGVPGMQCHATPGARIGAGGVLSTSDTPRAFLEQFPRERITMAIAAGGYVGVAWAERDQTSVAAAFDAAFVRECGSPAAAIRGVLESVGFAHGEALAARDWHGTPALTTKPAHNAAERLFAIGDAAGYVEPFTGEGMAMALECAVSVAPLAMSAIRAWRPGLAAEWERLHRQRIQRRQRFCAALARLLRQPALWPIAFAVMRVVPALPRWIVRRINHLPAARRDLILEST